MRGVRAHNLTPQQPNASSSAARKGQAPLARGRRQWVWRLRQKNTAGSLNRTSARLEQHGLARRAASPSARQGDAKPQRGTRGHLTGSDEKLCTGLSCLALAVTMTHTTGRGVVVDWRRTSGPLHTARTPPTLPVALLQPPPPGVVSAQLVANLCLAHPRPPRPAFIKILVQRATPTQHWQNGQAGEVPVGSLSSGVIPAPCLWPAWLQPACSGGESTTSRQQTCCSYTYSGVGVQQQAGCRGKGERTAVPGTLPHRQVCATRLLSQMTDAPSKISALERSVGVPLAFVASPLRAGERSPSSMVTLRFLLRPDHPHFAPTIFRGQHCCHP